MCAGFGQFYHMREEYDDRKSFASQDIYASYNMLRERTALYVITTTYNLNAFRILDRTWKNDTRSRVLPASHCRRGSLIVARCDFPPCSPHYSFAESATEDVGLSQYANITLRYRRQRRVSPV